MEGIGDGRFDELQGYRTPDQMGESGDSVETAFQLPNVLMYPLGKELQDVRRKTLTCFCRPGAKDSQARLQVRRLYVNDKAACQTRADAVF